MILNQSKNESSDNEWEHIRMLSSSFSSLSDIEFGFDVLSPIQQRSIDVQNTCKYEKLPRALKPGDTISIVGRPTFNCQSLAVNLLSKTDGDIAFHFNPRFLQRYIVRNSRIKGQWGEEETLCRRRFPFELGEEFVLLVFAADDRFHVSLGDQHLCSFAYRLPLSKIDRVVVEGKGLVEVTSIVNGHVDDGYPIGVGNVVGVKEIKGIGDEIVDVHMNVPLLASLSEGFQIGWQLEIYGRVKILPYSFSITLQNSYKLWPPVTIPLAIDVNLVKNTLSRNAFVNEKWGQEERSGNLNFASNVHFKIGIRKGAKKFTIWINDKLQGEFYHRTNPDHIAYVALEGDVWINGIVFNKNPDNYNLGK